MSNVPASILHTRDNDPPTLVPEGENTAHSDNNEEEHSFDTVNYKLPDRGDKNVDRQNAVKNLDESSKMIGKTN